ncbi:MAG TPA: polysaccharide pyruvyl transferase family protein [Candidatus Paceibacterota bacterium]|nr:polysaccharide pyruvyl transferase family protein [Candidatus Paceibacterota bacterium]
MKFLIVNAFHRDDKGDAALLHVLIDQLLVIDPCADISIASMEDPRVYPTFYKGHNVGSFEFQSSSHAHRAPWHIFFKVYIYMALRIVAVMKGRCTWLFFGELKKVYDACRSADLVVSVGGGYFITKKDGLDSPMHLVFALQTLALCKAIGKKVATAPVSVGPFQRKCEGKYAARILAAIDLVLLREAISTKYFLDKRGMLAANIRQVPDSAFAFLPEGVFSLREVAGATEGERVLALAVRNWMTADKQRIYEQAHADLIDHIAVYYPDIKVVFVPQCTFPHAGDDDRIVARNIIALSRSKRAVAIEKVLDYKEVKLAYEHADFVVGTRFHSMVFSLSYLVPGIAIEYEHKTRGIMRDLGLEEWVLRIDTITSKELIVKFDALVGRKSLYKEYLAEVMPRYKAASEEAVTLFSQLLSK